MIVMTPISVEDSLIQCLTETVVPHSFKRIEKQWAETPPVVAAWKRRSMNMNRGIALVRFSEPSDHPGEFARGIKKAVGKSIGYWPIFNELGLQLILIGRCVLDKSIGLDRFLDSMNTQTVILQSIHLVDVTAGEFLGDVPMDGEIQSEISLPEWVRWIEWVGKLRNPFSGGFQRGEARLRYSVETGRAAISARTWSQTKTGPVIDAIEAGIERFVRST
jgi:hypothetical protein